MSKISAVLHFPDGDTIGEITVYQVPRIGERMTYYSYPGSEEPMKGLVTDVEWVSSPLGALSQAVHIYLSGAKVRT